MATGLVATVLTVVTGGTELGAKGEIKTKSILADRMPRMAPYAAKRGVSLLLDPLNPIFGGNWPCLFTVADALALAKGSLRRT